MKTQRDRIGAWALAFLMLAFLAGPASGAEEEVEIGQSCPPDGLAKSDDINEDGTTDWKISEMTDTMGNKVTLWCVDAANGEDPFFALLYTPTGGKPRFVGKCAFAWGRNIGSKVTDTNGKFTSTMWMTRDSAGYDDDGNIIEMHDLDGDDREDKYIFEYDVGTNKVTFRNLENNMEIAPQMLTPKEPPFKITDLPGNEAVGNLVLDESLSCGCEGCMEEDRTPPLCFISGQEAGPPARLEVTAKDHESGIASIEVLTLVNAELEIPKGSGDFYMQGDIATFTPEEREGTRLIEAVKIDQMERSQVILRVRNGAGLETTCDPVITLAVRERGKPAEEIITGIPRAESLIDVHNGTPGVTNLHVTVNGQKFVLSGLGDGETRTLDVSAAMLLGNANVIALSALGKPGGSAMVVIHD